MRKGSGSQPKGDAQRTEVPDLRPGSPQDPQPSTLGEAGSSSQTCASLVESQY